MAHARLPALLPHSASRELVRLLLPTYAAASSVDDAEAQDRLERAFTDVALREDLYRALATAMGELRGPSPSPRNTEDHQLDRLSTALGKRHNFKEAASTPAISAAMVRLDVSAGVNEAMAAVLASDKGRALCEAGFLALGRQFAKELLK